MGLFSRDVTMAQAGLFKGFTDFHSHILPGVDDGVRTLEESLRILKEYEEAGVARLWLTPHIMEDIPNSTDRLREVFGTLKESYAGPVELKLAAENMLDSLFEERLSSGDLLPMASGQLLVETSYYNPPMDLHALISRIKKAGYYPVLAHPERYMYMDRKEYEFLKSEGVLFQLNLPSVCGYYGEPVRKKAEELLRRGMYDMAGTDLHREVMFRKLCEHPLGKKIAGLLKETTNN